MVNSSADNMEAEFLRRWSVMTTLMENAQTVLVPNFDPSV